MIEAVIFDMDGVIIDSEPIHYELFMKFTQELGYPISNEEYSRFIGSTNIDIFTMVKNKYNADFNVNKLVGEYDNKYVEFLEIEKDIKPIDGVKELISNLYKNNIKLALASSSPRNHIDMVLSRFGIRDFFSTVVSGAELERSKPFPDIFLKAAKNLEIQPERCIVIEDSCNGVNAAKNAGMRCIGYYNPNSGNQDISKADKIINSFKEVLINEIKHNYDK